MTFTTGDPDGEYPSTSVRNDGIVPPYLSKDWQRMRSNLRIVAAHAIAGAEASTIEDVRKNIGAASMGLIDADFLRRTIERAENRDD